MKFGVLYTLRNPPVDKWFKPWPQFYAEALDHIAEVDRLGFHSVNFCEHHFDPDGYDPSPIVMMTAAAQRTKRVMIGQNILQLPYHHPVRLAEDLATIDILSGGRVTLQAGQAGFVDGKDLFADEFRALGVNPKFRPSLMEEGLEIVRRCWTEESFSFEGKRWKLEDVRVYPKPLQKPHPPIFTVTHGEASMDRAARLGINACAWGATGVSEVNRAAWNSWRERWRGALAKHGRRREDFQVNSQGMLFVTEDPERAWAKHRDAVFYTRAYHRHNGSQPYLFQFREQRAEKPEDIMGWESVFLTPDEVVRRMRATYKDEAPDEIMFLLGPGISFEDSLESLKLFADKVMPHLEDL